MAQQQRHTAGGAVVLGAGVVGLTTALTLVRDGVKNVEVWAEYIGLAKETTSYGAGALWSCPPFQVENESQATQYVLRSLRMFNKLSREVPEAGVHVLPSVVVERKPMVYNDVARRLSSYRRGPEVLKSFQDTVGGQYVDAEVHDAPIADPRVYLPWLIRELEKEGATFVRRKVSSLEEVAAACPGKVIVNCTGIGAKTLVPDDNMFPVRGQVLRIHAPWIKAVINDDNGAYVIPRPCGDCICGGTAHVGETDLTVNEETTKDILRRVTEMIPSLAKGRFIEGWVGLRPKRKGGVRVEKETLPSGATVVHNYGHGGAGYCMSWGSAEDSSALVRLVLTEARL